MDTVPTPNAYYVAYEAPDTIIDATPQKEAQTVKVYPVPAHDKLVVSTKMGTQAVAHRSY